jgi:putative transposase
MGSNTRKAAGARCAPACEIVGITIRTLQRWRPEGGLETGDRRPQVTRQRPAHALSEAECEAVLSVANEARFADMPAARIVPASGDEGVYLASESTFVRLLRERGQTRHRGRAKAPRASRPPTTHIATAPRQVWCWDMTYLPATVLGRWYFLYLILDLYSRTIVSWEVHETDDSHHASHLVARAALSEGIHALDAENRPVLHGDNGATLKATTVLAMLQWLGINPSYSRPRVSDDNALRRVVVQNREVSPEFPVKGFSDVGTARVWATKFVHWYNHEHAHSGFRYVSPAQRHSGDDVQILASRHALYQRARNANPRRWSRSTRNCTPITVATLNPERDSVIQELADQQPRSVA